MAEFVVRESSHEELRSLELDDDRFDIVANVPREIALIVLSYATVEDLCKAEAVSRTWHNLCQDHHLQLKLQQHRFEFLFKKENASRATSRETRRYSSGMINCSFVSPLADLQRASPTPSPRRPASAEGNFFASSNLDECAVQFTSPRPQANISAIVVGGKASKKRLKRF